MKIKLYTNLVAATLLLGVIACSKSPQEQEEEMIRQVQQDIQADQEIVKDSIKFANSFEKKPVEFIKVLVTEDEDDDGDFYTANHYYLIAPDKKVCQVDSVKYATVHYNDTIPCQWSDSFEQ